LYYHGTTAGVAQRAAKEGLRRPLVGRRIRRVWPYGRRGVIYATRSPSHAVAWARIRARRYGGSPAVIGFTVPRGVKVTPDSRRGLPDVEIHGDIPPQHIRVIHHYGKQGKMARKPRERRKG